jgi:hypothetical protein
MAASLFSVLVKSPTPKETAEALEAADVRLEKPTPGSDEINESDWVFGPEILAVIEIESADLARARVHQIVGEHSEVFPAQPYSNAPTDD